MTTPPDNERKTLILTGASRGIGHATAKRFSTAGWRAITVSRHPFPEDCPWDAGPEDHIQVDLADPKALAVAILQMKERLKAQGSRLHHSVGSWPLLIDDTTEVLSAKENQHLLLLARAWPAGQAHVDISLQPSGDTTIVTIKEDATSGPARLMPKPVRDAQLHLRNIETLKRLAFVVEGRTR